jgi:lipid II:glycine glycyltransferase (peptidoglycan interpeptide bridge formation enzyme)
MVFAIYWGNSTELQATFKKMYLETMTKDNANSYYFFSDQYFQSLFTELKYKMKIFYAVYQEKIVSMSIFLFHRNIVHYHLSASDVNYRDVAPTNLLLLELSKYAAINGYNEIHLGGGLGGKIDNLYKFKKSFSKSKDYTYVIGKIIFNRKVYDSMTSDLEVDSFFPLYRKE